MHKALKDYLIVLFGTGISRGVSFLNTIIIARLLSTDDFGRFSLFFAVSALAWILPQAFDSVFVRYAKASADEEEKNELLKVSLFMKVVYGLMVLVISYPVSLFLAQHVFEKRETAWLLVLAMSSGVFLSFLMTIAAIFQEKENFGIYSFVYGFYTFNIFLMILVLKFVTGGFDLPNVVAVHVGVSFLLGILSLFFLLRSKVQNIYHINGSVLKQFFNFGKWVFSLVVFSYISTRIDMFFVVRYSSFYGVGIYSVGQQVTMVVSVMAGTLSNIMLPKSCAAVRSKSDFRKFIRESFFIVTLLVLLQVGLIILAPSLIRWVYASKYPESILLTQILLVGWIFYVIAIPIGNLFYAMEDSKTRFWIEMLRFSVAFIGLRLFVPRFDMVGAASVMSASHILTCFAAFFVLKMKWDVYTSLQHEDT